MGACSYRTATRVPTSAAVAFTFRAGVPVTRRVAIVLHGGGIGSTDHGRTPYNGVVGFGPHIALTDRIGLTLALGLAQGAGVVGPEFQREEAFGVVGAVTYGFWDIGARYRMQVELAFELVILSNVTLSIGASWGPSS